MLFRSGDTSSESRERSQDDILSELSYGSTRDRDDRDGRDADDGDFPQVAGEAPTLREHLLSQLALLNLTGRDRTLTGLLIDTLDDSGYLTQSLDEVLAMLPGELAVEPDELVDATESSEPAEAPASPRTEVHTATYRFTRKGPERGKWVVDVVAEADAPLATVATVVKGVEERSGEGFETDRMSGDDVRAVLAAGFMPPLPTPEATAA